jgi:hypothetical protein
MKKFICFGETEDYQEQWLLIDAKDKNEAMEIAFRSSDLAEIQACTELTPNDESGISHTFICID